MSPILSGALIGAGQFGQQLQKDWAAENLENMREQAATARQAALIDAQKSMQISGQEHADKTLGKTQAHADATLSRTQDFTKNVTLPHQTSERTASQDFQRANEVEVRQPFQKSEREATQAVTVSENAKNRALDEKRIGMEGARLGLAGQQFELAKQQAALAIESGGLDLKNKKRIDEIQTEVSNATTPAEVERATAKLYSMLGKDKFIVSKERNAMGDETTTVLNAHTGRPIADAEPATGARWDAKSGRVLLDGAELGRAQTRAEASAMIAKARSTTAKATPAVAPQPEYLNTVSEPPAQPNWLERAQAYKPRGGLLAPR